MDAGGITYAKEPRDGRTETVRSHRAHWRWLMAAALCGLCGEWSGCVTIKEKPSGTLRTSDARNRPDSGTGTSDLPPLTPAGVTRTTGIDAEMILLGSVPFVEPSLPLVSPNAHFLATQAGVSPTWPTVLAEPGATVPEASRIDIYELDLRPAAEVEGPREPRLVTTVDRPAILGRSCTPEGFLVEVPQEDGSRWIGLAAWDGGAIRWLVADGHVNAFATLGADGVLAWSRRAIDGAFFELVVRSGGSEWSMPAQTDEDWLMPTWSPAGDGLFALRLSQGRLDCVFMRASSKAAARQSLRQVFLASDADREVAMRTFSGQITVMGVPTLVQDQVVMLHPAMGRAAIWRPLGSPAQRSRAGSGLIQLTSRSFAALADQPNYALVTTDRQLIRQSLSDPQDQVTVVRGTAVPRPADGRPLDYILLGLGPGSPDRVGITGMRLLPPETSATQPKP